MPGFLAGGALLRIWGASGGTILMLSIGCALGTVLGLVE